MEMTRERLEDYRSKKDEIKELRYKLAHLGKGDSMMGADTIFDYQTGFPRPQAVVGVDRDKMNRLEARYEKRIAELEADCAEVELWIEEIPDSLTRRIFRMYFIDEMKQSRIAKRVYVAQSVVSEKISKYLKSDKNDKKVCYNQK